LSPDQAGFLLSAGSHAILAADLLDWLATTGYRASTCADGAHVVEGQVLVLLAGLAQLADRLTLAQTDETPDRVSLDRLRAAAVDCLRRWRIDESVGRGAIAVAMAGEWTENIARLEDDLEQPVKAAVEAARIPWWR
jgi:ATP-dependent protease HslVU (ClpYQ) peptidase subunit